LESPIIIDLLGYYNIMQVDGKNSYKIIRIILNLKIGEKIQQTQLVAGFVARYYFLVFSG
jgi:hypothetical protein